ncbi:unnamed protein product [Ambrosiozyma monospora]|uniref:Unnamed protein product n=1 Tax=Ambrosiozyma monospora TaxID=43982 RepID=A0A9W6SWD0_AMBMO|nr:unnamed protein product [Ambrosiozyma monospora]
MKSKLKREMNLIKELNGKLEVLKKRKQAKKERELELAEEKKMKELAQKENMDKAKVRRAMKSPGSVSSVSEEGDLTLEIDSELRGLSLSADTDDSNDSNVDIPCPKERKPIPIKSSFPEQSAKSKERELSPESSNFTDSSASGLKMGTSELSSPSSNLHEVKSSGKPSASESDKSTFNPKPQFKTRVASMVKTFESTHESSNFIMQRISSIGSVSSNESLPIKGPSTAAYLSKSSFSSSQASSKPRSFS